MSNNQAKSVTTSIRLQPALRRSLESLAQETGHGMSWLIEKALEEYIARHQRQSMIKEARKDILYLNQQVSELQDETFWDQIYDDSGWEA
jgi:predicted DNA-binding protein